MAKSWMDVMYSADGDKPEWLLRAASMYVVESVRDSGGCDHAVGICTCADAMLAGRLAEKSRRAIVELGESELTSMIVAIKAMGETPMLRNLLRKLNDLRESIRIVAQDDYVQRDFNVWNLTARHWALERPVATREEADACLPSLYDDKNSDTYEVRMMQQWTISGRPVVVLDTWTDGRDHGYVYRFDDEIGPQHWINSGDARISTR